jgi:hypothetical protein
MKPPHKKPMSEAELAQRRWRMNMGSGESAKMAKEDAVSELRAERDTLISAMEAETHQMGNFSDEKAQRLRGINARINRILGRE